MNASEMKRLKKMRKKNEENDKERVGEECSGEAYWGWDGGCSVVCD